MNDLVPAQRTRLAEAFPANLADEGPRARVHGHVPRQVVVRVEHLRHADRKHSLVISSGFINTKYTFIKLVLISLINQ